MWLCSAQLVLPSIQYWKQLDSDQKCVVGNYIVKVGGVQAGKESNGKIVDTEKLSSLETEIKWYANFIIPHSVPSSMAMVIRNLLNYFLNHSSHQKLIIVNRILKHTMNLSENYWDLDQ